MRHVDVAIIGGSLAGAACVRELARRGIDAVAFERDQFPREKVCGGFLSPRAIDLLDELGVRDAVRTAGATTVRAATIRIGGREIPVKLPRPGLGISRKTLDAIVADHPGVQRGFVRGVRRDGGTFTVQLEAGEISARVVVDAAGKLSQFSQRRAVPEFGVQFYEAGARDGVLDFWFFEEGYGGAVAVEGDRTNACFLVSRHALQAASPLLARRGGCAIKRSRASDQNRADGVVVPISLFSNHPGASRHPSWPGGAMRLVTGPLAYERLSSDFISIGDAAGMVDPFSGEGMRHALDTGISAAKAIASGLSRNESYDAMRARYEQESGRRWNGKRRLGKFIRHMLKRPRLTSFSLGMNPEYWFGKLWD